MGDLHSVVTVEGNYPAGKMLTALIGLCLVFALPAWFLDASVSGMAPPYADMSEATFVEIRRVDGTVEMSGELRSRVDALGNVEKDAALLGPRREQVIGEIEIEIPRRDAVDQRQELEVDVISLRPHTTYHVILNDRAVAAFDTDDRGSVDVEFISASSITP